MFLFVALAALYGGVAFWQWSRVTASPRRWVAGGMLLVPALAIAGFLVAELYMAAAYHGTDTNRIGRASERWIDRHVTKNSRGFRDDGWSRRVARGDGLVRIGVIGSAATVGQGIERTRDRFSDILGRRLNARGDGLRYQVMNIAGFDWGTQEQLLAVRGLVPDLVLDDLILVYAMSDIRDLTFTDASLEQLQETRSDVARWFGGRSLVLNHLTTRTVRARGLGLLYTGVRGAYAEPRTWEFQMGRLRRISDIAASEGIRLRVVILPLLGEGWESYTLRAQHRQVQTGFAQMGVEFIDLTEVFEATSEPVGVFWAGRGDIHPNERAHALVADAIYRAWYDIHP